MPIRLIVLLILVACSSSACGQSMVEKAEKDELYHAEDEDADMQRAFEKARLGLEGFLGAWRSPPTDTSDFAVKVGLKEGDDTEYFWISPFREEGDGFKGLLNNKPRMVRNVAIGDEVSFTRSEIVDWLYFIDGKMVGNFTACAMLMREKESDRMDFEKRYGLRCET